MTSNELSRLLTQNIQNDDEKFVQRVCVPFNLTSTRNACMGEILGYYSLDLRDALNLPIRILCMYGEAACLIYAMK